MEAWPRGKNYGSEWMHAANESVDRSLINVVRNVSSEGGFRGLAVLLARLFRAPNGLRMKLMRENVAL